MSQSKNFTLATLRSFTIILLTFAVYSLAPIKVEAKSMNSRLATYFYFSDQDTNYPNIEHSQDDQSNSVLISDTPRLQQSPMILASKADLVASSSEQSNYSTRLVKNTSVSFLLMFFVPLGIFFPLFLFFRMLLVKPDEPDDILKSDHPPEKSSKPLDSEDLINSVLKTEQEVNQATVSKLQIAFTPPATQLREELNRVTSIVDLNENFDLVDLMHQTVEVLIEQGYWTHLSYGSITLPLKKVRAEFELISAQERNKFLSKTPSLVNYNHNRKNSSSGSYQESYSYVVVTLILCTSHANPLFKTINTKEQLDHELRQLGKLERDSVIEFELLWNPQDEGTYISNDQLLTKYGDMNRLL